MDCRTGNSVWLPGCGVQSARNLAAKPFPNRGSGTEPVLFRMAAYVHTSAEFSRAGSLRLPEFWI